MGLWRCQLLGARWLRVGTPHMNQRITPLVPPFEQFTLNSDIKTGWTDSDTTQANE